MANFTFSDGMENIYKSFKPASKNLFEIEIYTTGSEGEDVNLGGGKFNTEAISKYAKFHAVSVKIDDEYLSLKRNDLSKLFQVDGNESYVRANKLSIKWRESSDWEVRKYHEAWIGKIYNKEKDVYLSLTSTPYRKIIIRLPEKYSLECSGILPKNIGNFELAWGKGSSIVEPQLDYYVTKISEIKYGNS